MRSANGMAAPTAAHRRKRGSLQRAAAVEDDRIGALGVVGVEFDEAPLALSETHHGILPL